MVLVTGPHPLAFDRLFGALVLVPVARAGAIPFHDQVAHLADRHFVARVVHELRLVARHHGAAPARAHRAAAAPPAGAAPLRCPPAAAAPPPPLPAPAPPPPLRHRPSPPPPAPPPPPPPP